MRDAWTKQRPFPHRGFCCPVGSIGTYGRLRFPPGLGPLPEQAGYRTEHSGALRRSPGRGGPPQFPPSPSERSAPSTPGSSSGLHSRLLTPSMAFAVKPAARLSLDPYRGSCNDAAGFAYRYGPLSRSPKGALDAGLRPDPFPDRAASLLPGLLAATRTGLTPASDDELMSVSYSINTPRLWAHSSCQINDVTFHARAINERMGERRR
jgi:hypothetical protein